RRGVAPRAAPPLPLPTGQAHRIALGRVKDAALDAVGGAGRPREEDPREEDREHRGGDAPGGEPPPHFTPPAGAAPPACRRSSSATTRRRGMPRFVSSTMAWNQRSATSEITRSSLSPLSAAVTTSVAS